MATRSTRTRNARTTSKTKMTQAEINRVKPDGVLSFGLLEEKSQAIAAINIKFPDGQIYKFFHVPMLVGDVEDLIKTAAESNRLVGLRTLLSNVIVNEDGSQFATADQWRTISAQIINLIYDAISASAKDEPGED